MRRLLAVLLAPVVFVALAPAAPVPKHLMKNPAPVYYYPTTVGAKWVYDGRNGALDLVVDKVQEVKGAKVVTVTSEGKAAKLRNEVMEVSEGRLARVGWASDFDTPMTMLQGPIRVGTSWAIKTAGVEGVGTIAALEQVTVPAGTFETVQVEIDYTLGGRAQQKARAWYAPHVGLVKMTDGDDNLIWLLKSFTPGK